ncbi:isopenicillin N synthase family dioxygenase [Thalassolituus sp. LLYu03]|uniref:isopenicillin N synthase family dioxygenase n=1 Tax=Thalassolituus sp. LLYu03 TaxID=3421656 RepID=UPI003D284D31
MTTIPVIDISALSSPDRADWAGVIQQIDHACREIGFLAITGHGISKQQLDAMFDLSKRFFEQPMDAKRAMEIANSSNHRGWGSHGAEQLDPSKPTDWKETFDMALDVHPEHPVVAACPELYGPNQYGDMPGFQQQMNQHYGLLLSVAKKMLAAMALALNLEETFFTRWFDSEHVTVLRLIHYPPRPADQPVAEDAMAAGAHTDYGCITLLAQDAVGGLEVQGNDGNWISAPPIDGALVVNIGDLMQRWTNDAYRSTAHRVRNLAPGKHRYSMPFFVEPQFDTPVSCIDTCLAEGEQAKYPPITSGEWILSRFAATYAYRQKTA